LHTYIVKSGDCFASIAKQFGFHDADIVYQHPVNAELKKQRANLHILNPGDKVCIPDKKTKTVDLTSDVCTVFMIKGLLTEVKLLIADFDGNPLANTDYQLDVAGALYLGRSDESGMLVQKIDASAKRAELTLFLDAQKKDTLFWSVDLGGLTPHSEISGIQARLNNLGYFCANESGDIDSTTNNAIKAFKINNGLTNDSVIDHALTSKLVSVYGI
jgi:N-acetylmuramoyl-L-alanine amidase